MYRVRFFEGFTVDVLTQQNSQETFDVIIRIPFQYKDKEKANYAVEHVVKLIERKVKEDKNV